MPTWTRTTPSRSCSPGAARKAWRLRLGRRAQPPGRDRLKRHFSLPAGTTVVRATSPQGGKGCPEACPPLPSPVAHQRPKRGGRSHHQHPSRTARRCAVRGGDTRGAALLRFFAADAGNPSYPASDAAFRESPTPHRRGLRPLRKRRCADQDHVPLRCPPPRLKGGHPSDGICLTPRGGNRRSFQGHWVSLFLAPIHPRVCGEQGRDQHSRMAEDGPSLGGDRGGSWVCGGPRGRRSIRTLVYGPCRSGRRRPTASTESRCMGVRLPLPDDIHSGGCLDATGSTAGCARGRLHFKEGAIFGRSDGHSPQQWFGEKL